MSFTPLTPGNLQAVGIAVEATPGVAAATPTLWIPVSSPKYTPKRTSLEDSSMRGNMAKTQGNQLGGRYDVLSYATSWYADSGFVHLLAALGTADTMTGSADPYTHSTALLNSGNGQPKTHTVWYLDGTGNAYAIPGCQLSNLKISVKVDGLVSVDAEWTGMPAVNGAAPVNTPSTLAPAPGWNSVVKIGGTELDKYSEVSLTYKRNVSPVWVLNGTTSPGAIYCGELDSSVDLTGVWSGEADLDWQAYLTDNQPALTVTLGSASDATHRLTLQHSKVAYTDASFAGDSSFLQITAKCTPIPNATDALAGGVSPVKASLTSAQSTAFA